MSSVITLRVEQEELGRIDAARGALSRSEWIRKVITTALDEPAGLGLPGKLPVSGAWKKDCRHPPNRRLGTFCGACGRQI